MWWATAVRATREHSSALKIYDMLAKGWNDDKLTSTVVVEAVEEEQLKAGLEGSGSSFNSSAPSTTPPIAKAVCVSGQRGLFAGAQTRPEWAWGTNAHCVAYEPAN